MSVSVNPEAAFTAGQLCAEVTAVSQPLLVRTRWRKCLDADDENGCLRVHAPRYVTLVRQSRRLVAPAAIQCCSHAAAAVRQQQWQ